MAKRNVQLVQDSVNGLETSNGINVAQVTGAVTDNAIARFDGTTGAIQNSGVVISDNGNVGIGVIPSLNGNFSPTLQIKNTVLHSGVSGDRALLAYNYDRTGGVNTYISTGFATYYQQASGVHSWHTAPSGTAGNPITWNTAMTLGSNGNLLVGTTTDNGSKVQISSTGVKILSINTHASGIDIASDGNFAPHYITDFTVYKGAPGNGVSKLQIAPTTDNLLIGTTTDNGVDKLQVNGSIAVTSLTEGVLPVVTFNLNDAKVSTAKYVVSSTNPNVPIAEGGYLEVFVHIPDSYAMQRFTAMGYPNFGNSGRTFVRCLVNNAWSSWSEK